MRRIFALALWPLMMASTCTGQPSANVAAVGKPAAEGTPGRNTEIKTGAENMAAYRGVLSGKKIGIVTNQTGIVTIGGNKISVVDFLIGEKFDIVRIFAPEHGFRGTADAGEHIENGRDAKTGLPIISLYGDNKKPKPEQLSGLDAVVFDLQDVGARFYTYISTLHYVMEACAESHIPLVIFDRPNPNGNKVFRPLRSNQR